MNDPIVELRDVTKVYSAGDASIAALRGVTLSIEAGEFVAILGRSGSGKSTLLSLLGLLDAPSSGEILVSGRSIRGLTEAELARLRNREIGFVFQNFHLLPYDDALSNVELPLLYADAAQPRQRAEDLLRRVGLGDRLHHMPSQLSGGQRQRVAVARAVANAPALILADEPTGNLDTESGRDVLALFKDLHEQGSAVVIVTHDQQVAGLAHRVVQMTDGSISSDKRSLFGGGR